MPQHVQLQQVILHAVVFKMGGDGLSVLGVRRMLHGGEILHVHVIRHHHKAAGVLAGGAPHAHAAQGEAVHLRIAGGDVPLLQILAHEAVGGLFRQRSDGTGAEHLRFAEHLHGVAVSARLILAGKIQVNIRHLAAAVAQKGFKRNVKSVLHHLFAAHGASFIRHVRAAAVAAVCDKFRMSALGAAVVGRQGVHLRDARHIGHQRRADGASGANQIAVFQTPLHQLLRRHIHHVVLAQNAAQLHVQPVHNELGRLVAVQLVTLVPHHVVQLLLGVFQPRREQLPRRQQLDLLHHVGDHAGILHHHLIGRLLAEIGKLLQHLVGGLEVDGQALVRIGKFLAGQQHMAVNFVLRLHEVHVAGGADGLMQLSSQPHDGAVELPQLLLVPRFAASQHEPVVAQGLDLQIVIKGRNTLQLVPILVLHHGAEQLAGLAGGADDKPLSVRRQLRFGNDGKALEVVQVGQRHQLIQVLQPQLILGQNDDVLGAAVALVAQRAQLQHLLIDLLQAADAQLPPHFFKKRNEHVAHHTRVVRSAVMVEGRQIQMLRHDVQLELAQLRQQILRQDQGIHIGGVKGKSRLPAALPNEADVKLGVVCRQRTAVHEPEKALQRLLEGRSVLQHGVGNAGEADNFRRQPAVWIHKGLEPLRDLPVFQHHGANLRDGLLHHVQPRGLNVEADDLVFKRLIHGAVDGHAVVQIVHIVPLHAVEDLDLPLGGVPCVGERLHHAVVGDGNGRMPPGNGLLDNGGGIREGVHV